MHSQRHRHECASEYTGSSKRKFACISTAAVHTDTSSVQIRVTCVTTVARTTNSSPAERLRQRHRNTPVRMCINELISTNRYHTVMTGNHYGAHLELRSLLVEQSNQHCSLPVELQPLSNHPHKHSPVTPAIIRVQAPAYVPKKTWWVFFGYTHLKNPPPKNPHFYFNLILVYTLYATNKAIFYCF